MTRATEIVAEVISIGDEMTSGARLDTNGQWLSQRLGEIGIHVAFHTTVGDRIEHNVDVFRVASERADVVIATGGLGPTRDDLTREVLAELAEQPLEFDQDAMDHLVKLFAKRNRVMPERNKVQAMFPRGSQQVFNPQGSAPGIDISIPRSDGTHSRIFALPGVPAEMKCMFVDTVVPRLVSGKVDGTVIQHHVMKLFGTGESDMEQRLGDMISRNREPRVGITVSKATISLRITATADSEQSCQSQISETRKQILELVPEFYFGEGETFEQHHAINHLLCSRQESLMVIELGHAAPLGDWFASLGETPAFQGGLSLGSADDLRRWLPAIPGETINCDVDSHESMTQSNELFEQQLESFRQCHQVDWLLLVDAYPFLQESGSEPMAAKQLTFWVVSPSGRVSHDEESIGGHPDVIQPRIAKAAMAFLRHQVGIH